MKPKNFPTRKLLRKIMVNRDKGTPYSFSEEISLENARRIKTKKNRENRSGTG